PTREAWQEFVRSDWIAYDAHMVQNIAVFEDQISAYERRMKAEEDAAAARSPAEIPGTLCTMCNTML
ncbi:hypothetical protein A2U01_0105197, partial [Trifolium medium]|nr:hypothetical protein [Trifolium medium]